VYLPPPTRCSMGNLRFGSPGTNDDSTLGASFWNLWCLQESTGGEVLHLPRRWWRVKRGLGGRRVMMDMCRAEALSSTVAAPMAGLPRSML
jgi:hypothetical protein